MVNVKGVQVLHAEACSIKMPTRKKKKLSLIATNTLIIPAPTKTLTHMMIVSENEFF